MVMQDWLILGSLVLVALILLIIIIVVLVKNSGYEDDDYGYDDYEEDEEEEYDDAEDEEDEDEYEQPRRRKAASRRREAPTEQIPDKVREIESVRSAPAKRQWKIILENLETWEKFTFIFYDNIGIGRGRNNQEFEKYLSVPDDPRISKLHCAIVRKGEQLYLKDMGARNGTYLNGQRIQEPVLIQKDDIIGAGETKIEVKKVLRERG